MNPKKMTDNDIDEIAQVIAARIKLQKPKNELELHNLIRKALEDWMTMPAK